MNKNVILQVEISQTSEKPDLSAQFVSTDETRLDYLKDYGLLESD
jgi:hypothetical protein